MFFTIGERWTLIPTLYWIKRLLAIQNYTTVISIVKVQMAWKLFCSYQLAWTLTIVWGIKPRKMWPVLQWWWRFSSCWRMGKLLLWKIMGSNPTQGRTQGFDLCREPVHSDILDPIVTGGINLLPRSQARWLGRLPCNSRDHGFELHPGSNSGIWFV